MAEAEAGSGILAGAKSTISSMAAAVIGEKGVEGVVKFFYHKPMKFIEKNWPKVVEAYNAAAAAMGPYWIAAAAVAVAAIAAIAWWRSGSKSEEQPSVDNTQTRAAELAAARARSIDSLGDNPMARTGHAEAALQQQGVYAGR